MLHIHGTTLVFCAVSVEHQLFQCADNTVAGGARDLRVFLWVVALFEFGNRLDEIVALLFESCLERIARALFAID